MSQPPEISVVMATRNRARMLTRCLDAVARCGFSPERYEVIVVNNASEDDTDRVVERECGRRRMPLRLVEEPRIGLARARNTGAAAARGEGVVFLDDDGFSEQGWLDGFWRALALEKNSIAQGRIVPLFEAPPPNWIAPEFLPRYGGVDEGPTAGPLAGDLHGGNLGVRKDVFKSLGGFREELGLGGIGLGEDSDFGRRARAAGYQIVYAPDALMRHFIPRSRMSRSALLRRCCAGGRSQALIHDYPEPAARHLAGFARQAARRVVAGLFAANPAAQMRHWSALAEHCGRVVQILRQWTGGC